MLAVGPLGPQYCFNAFYQIYTVQHTQNNFLVSLHIKMTPIKLKYYTGSSSHPLAKTFIVEL